jgi:hypothetical protein
MGRAYAVDVSRVRLELEHDEYAKTDEDRGCGHGGNEAMHGGGGWGCTDSEVPPWGEQPRARESPETAEKVKAAIAESNR